MEWERELTTTPGLGPDRKPNVATLANAAAGKPGQYLLEITGKDPQGHDILTSVTFEVAGPSETVWNYRNPYAIDLVTDKETYEPGQTATILVKTPIAGEALVTVERDRVLRQVRNSPAMRLVQVPVAKTTPPFRFGDAASRANEPAQNKSAGYGSDVCELRSRGLTQAGVTVKANGATAKPGAKSSKRRREGWNRKRRRIRNRSAVDEGVLSLTGYKTHDPLVL